MSTAGELSIGGRLGKYLIERELGRGGMGIVYLARDTHLNRPIALKVLHPMLSADAAFIERFRAEAQAIAALNHPNIVHVNNLDMNEDRFLIDMEYVSGRSLQMDLRSRIYTLSKLVGLAHEILHGLAACHGEGIIHRDLKPSNVLITQAQNVKLCDFGLATAYVDRFDHAARETQTTGFYLGTPRYAPPELWEGATPTSAWDLYSLGVILYEGAVGETPFAGDNPLSVIKTIVSGGVPPVTERAPGISKELASLIHSLMSEEPAARPASASDAIYALESTPEFYASRQLELQTTIPIARTRRPPATLRPKPFSRPPWTTPALIGISITLILIAAVVSIMGRINLSPVRTERATSTPPLLAADMLSENSLIDANTLLSLPRTRSESSWVALHIDVLGAIDKRPLTGLLASQDASTDTLIAFSDRMLWRLGLSSAADSRIQLTGAFGGYIDDGATVFRAGTIQGTGLWVNPRRQMTASLEFADSYDNSVRTVTISVAPTTSSVSSMRFFYELEEAPLLLPLLYNELLPRHAQWSQLIDEQLPALAKSTLRPRYAKDVTADATVDGGMAESFWPQEAAPSADEVQSTLLGVPYTQQATLRSVCTDDHVRLGIRLPVGPGPRWKIEITVLPEFDAPVSLSPVYVFTQSATGERSATCRVAGNNVAWDCSWITAVADAGAIWTAEFAIPYASFRHKVTPEKVSRWRLNCQVLDVTIPEQARCIVRWGWPDLNAALHGVSLKFSSIESSS